MFDPVAARTTWNPTFTREVDAQVQEVRTWMLETLCRPETTISLDYNKRTQAGIVSPNVEEIEAHVPEVQAFVADTAPGLHVFATHVSIDVLPAGITKRQGLEWLSRRLDVPMGDIAYIGDTRGDLPALDEVGVSFAPANADPFVRERVDAVTEGPVIAGTLEAYRWCMRRNEALVAEAT